MDSAARHIRDSYPDKVEVVRKYIGAVSKLLREAEDFDRDALLFRIESGGLVTVSEEFFSDFDIDTILRNLKDWDIGGQVGALLKSQRLVVTTDGTFVEEK